ncbi:lea domain protein [Ophiostoma piceae UAMH 11346]|uniref:Lea domain protein n=1 Tax=Ophiostoma piceae (strain UAMH 11346) TaxID=1262450 RepID=S3CR04_OPHP1|nr:lea domain protein [Ophiostoma piceae UAMH 11346]
MGTAIAYTLYVNLFMVPASWPARKGTDDSSRLLLEAAHTLSIPFIYTCNSPLIPLKNTAMATATTPPINTDLPPVTVEYGDPPEEDIVDPRHGASNEQTAGSESEKPPPGKPRVKSQFHERGATPAYIPPMEKIGRISSLGRPQIAESLLMGLTGKPINEYGDVVADHDSTCVLGQVAGDLPDMVGRRVTTDKGDVFGDDGSLIGYVKHVGPESDEEENGNEHRGSGEAAQTLESFTQGGSRAFKVDGNGNILDGNGNVVGKMHDNKNQSQPRGISSGSAEAGKEEASSNQDDGSPPKQNAETFRKENESPSDIFLDVKSTREGIQLVIRIPTVFPGNAGPSIHVS